MRWQKGRWYIFVTVLSFCNNMMDCGSMNRARSDNETTLGHSVSQQQYGSHIPTVILQSHGVSSVYKGTYFSAKL